MRHIPAKIILTIPAKVLCQPWPPSLDIRTNLVRCLTQIPIRTLFHPDEHTHEVETGMVVLTAADVRDWDFSLWIKVGAGRKSEERLGLKAERAAEPGSDTNNLCGLGQAAEALFFHFGFLIAFLSQETTVQWRHLLSAHEISQFYHKETACRELCPPFPVRWGQVRLTYASF